ncbi:MULTISPECIES: acyltransferase family protein [Pseudomonas]|jgi:peptidoglycan/LPS O-acetylase OafA/YrhL|uniref:acyltransferase family protein n=1 Tax=Pseudomonas TaxID=286 RepID=UPI000F48ABC5|nr:MULTISPECIES: acyltransferase family protein [Pseudomonas]MDH1256414.1 acyltransferase [Pseudomonas atacamensis]
MFNRPIDFVRKPLRAMFNAFDNKEAFDTSRSLEAASCESHRAGLRYRADIDGLRAVAVLLVLIFHAGMTLFPSGFIGVDIFFVISGYLTTSIIMKSLENGTFSFTGFYVRRIWRLQPAVVALLVVTLLVTTLLYLPDDYVDFLKSEKYTSLLISNQYFSKVTSGYATPDAASLPLLHTWSLAIEWQWYLLLPLGIWLLHRYVAKRALSSAVLGLTLSATALALYLSQVAPDLNYYFFTARIFELMIGSCAVMFSADRFRLSRISASLICVVALVTIAYCAVQDDILSGFPNYHAVAACVATALLLVRGIGNVSITSDVLAFKPLVFIGTLSYSLYLWHWPILAVLAYLGVDLSPAVTVGYFAATFAMGYLSFWLIENRFRKVRAGFGKTVLLLILLPAIGLSLLHSAGRNHDGWPNRFGDDSIAMFSTLKAFVPSHREDCLGNSEKVDPDCVLGAPLAKPQALLIGDSYSNHYWGFIETLAKDAGLSVLAQGYPACLTLPGIYLYDWYKAKNALYEKCHTAAQHYYHLIADSHFQYVIIGQFWEAYLTATIVTKLDDPRSLELTQQRLEVAVRQALDIIVDSGATPIVLMSTLPMPARINECLLRQVKLRGMLGSAEQSRSCAAVTWSGLEDPLLTRLFGQLQVEYPQLIVLDPKKVQCTDGTCLTSVNGVPVYRDIGHVSDYASYKFGELYLKHFGNPFKSGPVGVH